MPLLSWCVLKTISTSASVQNIPVTAFTQSDQSVPWSTYSTVCWKVTQTWVWTRHLHSFRVHCFSGHWPINRFNFTKKLETECCQMHLFPPCAVSVWLTLTDASFCFSHVYSRKETCCLCHSSLLYHSPIDVSYFPPLFAPLCPGFLFFSPTKHRCVQFFAFFSPPVFVCVPLSYLPLSLPFIFCFLGTGLMNFWIGMSFS